MQSETDIATPVCPAWLSHIRPYLLGAFIGIFLSQIFGALGLLKAGTFGALCFLSWVLIPAPPAGDPLQKAGWIGAYYRFCAKHEKVLLGGLTVLVGGVIVMTVYWSLMAKFA